MLDIPASSPSKARKIEPPAGDVGFVDLLASMRNTSPSYVGETNNLRRLVSENYSGEGAFLHKSESFRASGRNVFCYRFG